MLLDPPQSASPILYLTCQRQNLLLLVSYVVGYSGVPIGMAGATRHSMYITWATIMRGVAIGATTGSFYTACPHSHLRVGGRGRVLLFDAGFGAVYGGAPQLANLRWWLSRLFVAGVSSLHSVVCSCLNQLCCQCR